MKHLRIGYLSTMYHTSHVIKSLKWIKKYLGLVTEWSLFGTGPSMIGAFSADDIDIGYIGLPPAMIGIGNGLPLKCISGGHVEGTVMIARPGCASRSSAGDILSVLKQFEGKKIGSPAQGSIHDVIIRFLIKKFSLNNIEVKNYAWADLIPEAIIAEEIDAAVGTPPLAVLSQKWYDHEMVIAPSRLWPFNPSYGIVVKKNMFGQAKMLEDFLHLHERACNLIIQKPDEAAQAVAEEVKVVDKDFILEVFSVSPRYCASVPEEYIDATMAFVPALQDLGYLDRNLTKQAVFELSFIEKVHPQPQHYFTSPG
jgi:NitT/TauT family transport system substrate-binding protein